MSKVEELVGRGRPRVTENPRFTSSPFEPERPPIQRLEDIDLTDPELYARGDPHSVWRLLREEAPVFWHSKGSRGTYGRGFWAVTRYEDCNTVHREVDIFSESETMFLDLLAEDIPRQVSAMDPPEHSKYRQILQPFFTPKALDRLVANLRVLAGMILEGVRAQDEIDFVNDVAATLPFLATCLFLDLPLEDTQSLGDLLRDTMESSDQAGPHVFRQYSKIVMDFFDQTTRVWPHDPKDNLVAAVLAAEIDGKPIPRQDALAHLWVLLTGGLHNNTQAAADGLLALFHHPDEFEKLWANPMLVPSAVEEILRWTATSLVVKHLATVDTVINGVEIKAGDYVATYPPSACRDEAAFPDPYRFDICRVQGNPIFAFGGGRHVCLGAHLSRLMLRALFDEMIERFPKIQLAGPAVRGESYILTLSPLERLPIRLGV